MQDLGQLPCSTSFFEQRGGLSNAVACDFNGRRRGCSGRGVKPAGERGRLLVGPRSVRCECPNPSRQDKRSARTLHNSINHWGRHGNVGSLDTLGHRECHDMWLGMTTMTDVVQLARLAGRSLSRGCQFTVSPLGSHSSENWLVTWHALCWFVQRVVGCGCQPLSVGTLAALFPPCKPNGSRTLLGRPLKETTREYTDASRNDLHHSFGTVLGKTGWHHRRRNAVRSLPLFLQQSELTAEVRYTRRRSPCVCSSPYSRMAFTCCPFCFSPFRLAWRRPRTADARGQAYWAGFEGKN